MKEETHMNSKDIKKLKLISTAIGQEVMQQCRLMLLEQKPLGEEGSDPGEKNKPKKFLEEKNLESFAYNKAFQNQVARIDELFSILQRIDDSLLRIEHRLDRQKKKIQLLFSIVRYIGYSAGVVEYTLSNKEMLNAWKRFSKKRKKSNKNFTIL